VASKSCAPTSRGHGVPRRGHAQFATLEIAHRFVPDAMLAFSALRNTENGPPFAARRDSVRLPSFQCGPQLNVSRSLLWRLLAVAARRQPVAADAEQHALTLVKRVPGRLSPTPSCRSRSRPRSASWTAIDVVDPRKRLLSRRRQRPFAPRSRAQQSAASCTDGTDRRVVGGAPAASSGASATLGVGRINAPRVP
jgi:hypothetical protein